MINDFCGQFVITLQNIWFQRSRLIRGGTIMQQMMPANRDHHLS